MSKISNLLRLFVKPLLVTFMIWFSGIGVFCYFSNINVLKQLQSLTFVVNFSDFKFFILFLWYFISTYYYSSRHNILVTALFCYSGLMAIGYFITIPASLYFMLHIWSMLGLFICGCYFFGGFRKFTTLLAKNIVEDPSLLFSLHNFCLFWLPFVNTHYPSHISALVNQTGILSKLRYLNYIVYCQVNLFYLVFVGLFFQYWVPALVSLSIYSNFIAVPERWFLVIILIKFLTYGLGLTALCFDKTWTTNIEGFLGPGAFHKLGFNGQGISIATKAAVATKTAIIGTASAATDVFAGKTATAANNLNGLVTTAVGLGIGVGAAVTKAVDFSGGPASPSTDGDLSSIETPTVEQQQQVLDENQRLIKTNADLQDRLFQSRQSNVMLQEEVNSLKQKIDVLNSKQASFESKTSTEEKATEQFNTK